MEIYFSFQEGELKDVEKQNNDRYQTSNDAGTRLGVKTC
jgi:hypothetical protein